MKTIVSILFSGLFFISSLSFAESKRDYLNVIDFLNIDDLRQTMLSVDEHGLKPGTYWTKDMEDYYWQGGAWSPDLKDRANENYLTLLQHMWMGVVNPEDMGVDVKLERKGFITAKQLQVQMLAHGTRAQPLLNSFAPKTPHYIGLKEALRKFTVQCNDNDWPSLPSLKKEVRLNQRNPALPAIKERMRQYGYKIYSTDDMMDAATADAVKDIQTALKIRADGVLSNDGKTFRYLDHPCLERIEKMRYDMEKLRWFPQTFEDKYIFVNLAMSYFTLIDNTGDTPYTMAFRTINGRKERKSPTMMDKIVYVVINPFWVVPPTIFREDKVEDIKKLQPWEITEYFASKNYEVWNSSFTQRVDPTTIDWWNMNVDDDAQYFIRQKPWLGNALGVLKFMMTNSFAIYLHDTNMRELFVENQRLLSSGCIRVEKPLDLAEYLLAGTPWTRDVIDRYTAKPGEVLEAETRVALKTPVPVYLAFLTSQMASDGVTRFVDDDYRQNARIERLANW